MLFQDVCFETEVWAGLHKKKFLVQEAQGMTKAFIESRGAMGITNNGFEAGCIEA